MQNEVNFMENQLHLRIKNPETKAKIDNICKSKKY